MARQHFWFYLNNGEGQAVSGASVALYEAGTTTPLYIFTSESGTPATNTVPQVTTDTNGLFEFWIADDVELNGYVSGSKFSMFWTKPAEIDGGSLEYIDFNTPRMLVATSGAIFTTSWTLSGSTYYYEVEHNLVNQYPIAQLYNDDTKEAENISIQPIDTNHIRVWKSDNPNAHITVIG